MATSAEYWISLAKYDLATAIAMLDSERFLYVFFCCQQAVEKMLKSIIADREKKLPPRSHNLLSLAKRAKIDINERNKVFFQMLSSFYIQTRYPEETADLWQKADKFNAREVLKQTKEFIDWLSSTKN